MPSMRSRALWMTGTPAVVLTFPVICLENIQIAGVILPKTADCFDVNTVVKINFKAVSASHLFRGVRGATQRDRKR